MTDVKITVGGAIEDEAASRFVNAWHRAERGESFRERHLAFESWDALARVLTGKRMELLRYVHKCPAASVQALAKALGRTTATFTRTSGFERGGPSGNRDGGIRADFHAIETKIAI
jgi:predicted transcriptional regulator